MSTPTLPEARLPSGGTTDLTMPQFVKAHFRHQTEPVDAVPVPFDTWAKHCRDEGGGVGLARGWYVAVGGGTGHGKSLLALNMAARAMEEGISPAFLSLEMSTAQLATRLYAILTGAPVSSLERGQDFQPSQAELVAAQVQEMRERTGTRFYCNREPLHELTDVLALMRLFVEEHGVRLLFLDYLQLVGLGDEDQLYREVTKISRSVRAFAQKMRVTVVALSQYNRSTSANRFSSPTPQGLIGSSSIENDADQVLLLDHSRYQRSPDGHTARTWALLGKNRHGGTGEIPVEWDYRCLRVREALPDEETEWPRRAA
jgi:replicative DNA helicase